MDGGFYFIVCNMPEAEGHFTAYVYLRGKENVPGDVYNGNVSSGFLVFGGEIVYPESMRGLKDFTVNRTDLLFMNEVPANEWFRVKDLMTAFRRSSRPQGLESPDNETGKTSYIYPNIYAGHVINVDRARIMYVDIIITLHVSIYIVRFRPFKHHAPKLFSKQQRQ